MAKIGTLKADTKKETEGVWVDYEDGIQFKIARLGNAEYEACLRKLSRPHLTRIRRNTIKDVLLESITKQAMAKHILLDWSNIEDDKGESIPYSKEKALEFLQDPALRDVYKWILLVADDQDVFRKEQLKDTEGNS